MNKREFMDKWHSYAAAALCSQNVRKPKGAAEYADAMMEEEQQRLEKLDEGAGSVVRAFLEAIRGQ